jgi:hypothetical protein
MVRFKVNVRIKELTPALLWMLTCVSRVSKMHALFPTIVITSINDSKHSENSRHYTDEAIDIRTHNFPNDIVKKIFLDTLDRELNRNPEATKLGAFTLLHESIGTPNEHFHIQVKRGEKYQ